MNKDQHIKTKNKSNYKKTQNLNFLFFSALFLFLEYKNKLKEFETNLKKIMQHTSARNIKEESAVHRKKFDEDWPLRIKKEKEAEGL